MKKYQAPTKEFFRLPNNIFDLKLDPIQFMLYAYLVSCAGSKGDATGEAFRNNGKTDICIERENRAAFVAECKMWTGQKDVQPAVEQLDSYLTWRDCKTALIYFVRRKDFLRVLSTAQAALRSIPFMRRVEVVDENELKCLVASKTTPGQLVQVRVMLFNLYSE